MDHDGRQLCEMCEAWSLHIVRGGGIKNIGSTSADRLMATPLPCLGALRSKKITRFLRGKRSCQASAAKGGNVTVHLTGRVRYSSS